MRSKLRWPDMLRVVCMAFMNAIPVVATIFGGIRRAAGLRHRDRQEGLYWIQVVGNIVAMIVTFVGDLSDRIGGARRSSSARSPRAS